MKKCVICGHPLRRALGFGRGLIAGGVTAFSFGTLALIFRAPIVPNGAQLPKNDLQQQASGMQETIEYGITDSIDAVSSVLPDAPLNSPSTDDGALSTDAGDTPIEIADGSDSNEADGISTTSAGKKDPGL